VGEKLDESHVTAAVSGALARARLEAAFFTAVPRFVPSPRWQIALELAPSAAPTDAALEALRADIDRALGEAADDYRVYRRSTLGAPSLVLLAPGEHERARRASIARGGQDAQLKVLHLQTDPDALASYRIERVVEPAG
jgi:hypothetical protein